MAKRKKKDECEIVTSCDQCGEQLARTCARSDGSALCAAGEGISVHYNCVWKFFCNEECAMAYRASATGIWR